VQLARAVAGQLEALMMVSMEAPGWWESPVIPAPQVDGLGNGMW